MAAAHNAAVAKANANAVAASGSRDSQRPTRWPSRLANAPLSGAVEVRDELELQPEPPTYTEGQVHKRDASPAPKAQFVLERLMQEEQLLPPPPPQPSQQQLMVLHSQPQEGPPPWEDGQGESLQTESSSLRDGLQPAQSSNASASVEEAAPKGGYPSTAWRKKS